MNSNGGSGEVSLPDPASGGDMARTPVRIAAETGRPALPMRVCSSPATRIPAIAAIPEAAVSAGFWRGLGWGLAIEGAAALLLYGIWHAAPILR